MSRKIDEVVFLFATFMIPFDNLFFAPSAGWATISPILFFVYIMMNIKKLEFNKNSLLLFVLVCIVSCINYLFYSPNASSIFDALSTIILGFSFYYSLDIYFIKKQNSAKSFLKVLFFGYLISLFYGVISLFGNQTINSIMSFLEKREYDRLQFTFTEPSFISMHLFGVIVPILIIFKDNKKFYKRFLLLLLMFLIVSIFGGKSMRFVIDFIAFIILYISYKFFKSKLSPLKKITIVSSTIVLMIIAFNIVMNIPRINSIVSNGIYSDSSMASRWFRINALLYGLKHNYFSMMAGYGFGNTFKPFNYGYDYALSQYTNSYMYEVNQLKNTTETSFFRGHLRIIADFGFIFYLLLFFKVFNLRKNNLMFFFLIVYLYIQFDSYAFYTFWLYLFYNNYLTLLRRKKYENFDNYGII